MTDREFATHSGEMSKVRATDLRQHADVALLEALDGWEYERARAEENERQLYAAMELLLAASAERDSARANVVQLRAVVGSRDRASAQEPHCELCAARLPGDGHRCKHGIRISDDCTACEEWRAGREAVLAWLRGGSPSLWCNYMIRLGLADEIEKEVP